MYYIKSIRWFSSLRNVGIIAHVDHGKTSLVDGLLRQAGIDTSSRLMDHLQLEKERGITIMSKVTSLLYKDTKINIIDTPGHADFGGEVERILRMLEGVVMVVDAQEGPMAQTKYVLGKALKMGFTPIVVLNKIDRGEEHIDATDSQLLDLFMGLGAQDHQLEYPLLYASAKQGWAIKQLGDKRQDMKPLLDAILTHIPPPSSAKKLNEPFKMLVTQIEANPYLGKLFLGKVESGSVAVNSKVKVLSSDGATIEEGKVLKLVNRQGLQQSEVTQGNAGDIVSIAGLNAAKVNFTICDSSVEEALPVVLDS